MGQVNQLSQSRLEQGEVWTSTQEKSQPHSLHTEWMEQEEKATEKFCIFGCSTSGFPRFAELYSTCLFAARVYSVYTHFFLVSIVLWLGFCPQFLFIKALHFTKLSRQVLPKAAGTAWSVWQRFCEPAQVSWAGLVALRPSSKPSTPCKHCTELWWDPGFSCTNLSHSISVSERALPLWQVPVISP